MQKLFDNDIYARCNLNFTIPIITSPMSSLEPQTTAKARLHTTKGTIDVELWAKETPITSRIFLNNILNQKFNGWQVNRILPNFIIQVDGSLNQEVFEDEFNTRIRFNRRGLLGSVNLSSRNSNTGKFFVTLKDTPELNNKNTIFGKVVGDSIFNVIKISEGELSDDGETPLYPVKIMSSEVLVPYFDDLKKEEVIQESGKIPTKKSKKKKIKVKLGFEEGEDDEEPVDVPKIKMKSAHQLLNDKKLSKEDVIPEVDIQDEGVTEKKEQENKEEAVENKIDAEDVLKEVKSEAVPVEPSGNTPEPEKEEPNTVSLLDQERTKYLTKAPALKISKKTDKELRELETLKLLKSFKNKIETKVPVKSRATEEKKSSEIEDDFDNLDDSDSDSDIYSHALRFDDNDKNKQLENEDLLITIDESKGKDLKKRRNDDFYRNQTTTSILSKKARK